MNNLIKDSLKERIENTKLMPIEFCLNLVAEIESMPFEIQVEWIQSLCEVYGNVELKNEDEVNESPSFTEDEITDYVYQSSKYINEIIRILTDKGHKQQFTKEKFYYELWKVVKNCGLLSTHKELAGAVVNIMNNDMIPYYVMNTGLILSDSEFDDKLKGSLEVFRKIRYIIALEYSDKTQTASLILEQILSLDNKIDQAIAFVIAWSILSDKENDLVKVLRKSLKEDEE